MNDRATYNLNGLRAVFWGMTIELVSAIGVGSMGWLTTKFSAQVLNYIEIGFSAISVIAFLMIIIGLSRVIKYSYHFRVSRRYYLWNVLLGIIATLLLVLAFWFVDKDQDSSGTLIGTVAMVISAGVLILIAGLLSILKIKQLMKGCAEIARQNEEKKYAGKCSRTWVYYTFFVVITAILAVVIFVVSFRALILNADQTGGNVHSVEALAGSFSYYGYFAAGLVFSLIMSFVTYLMVMGKVNGTLMRYHRVEVPQGVFEEEEPAVPAVPQVPEAAKAQLEPEADAAQESVAGSEPKEAAEVLARDDTATMSVEIPEEESKK